MSGDYHTIFEEEQAEKKTALKGKRREKVLSFFGGVLTFMIAAIAFLLTTPIVLLAWCINVVRLSFGMLLIWIVGKLCLIAVILAGMWIFAEQLKWFSMEAAEGFFAWCCTHIIGYEYTSVITNEIHSLPEGGVSFLPYPMIELPIAIILVILAASVETYESFT